MPLTQYFHILNCPTGRIINCAIIVCCAAMECMCMKKITLEEMRRSVDSGLFIIERCSITAKNMERAGFYIEELRKLHKELKCFVRYTCECSILTGTVIWFFMYRKDEHESLRISEKTDAIWNAIFPERPAGIGSSDPANSIFNEPCVCPFSGE